MYRGKHVNEIQRLWLFDEFENAFLKYFPGILGAVSEEQRESFHKDIKEMERRHQGRWNVNMMADYCWMLHREDQHTVYKRQSAKRSFPGEVKDHKDLCMPGCINTGNCSY
ncbi:hypothetical protein AVEN_58666-1 [Araneus ventricosus]|uniref:Uncharacterized protein n=1 Tax=Araneus ventricosus TaxID=182803 RepID=A0A4Y2I6V9_ARAVE|nr:hypothetical protein AVEN_58666-1 [Araneus ventricosus]